MCGECRDFQIPELEKRPGADLQARLREAEQVPDPFDGQQHHRGGAGEVRHHLHRGSYPRDLHGGSTLQGGKQLLVAFQAERASGWADEEEEPLRGAR